MVNLEGANSFNCSFLERFGGGLNEVHDSKLILSFVI